MMRPWRPSWISDQTNFSCFLSTTHSGHLGFLMGTILSFFDLQVIEMLPTYFRFNLLLVQAKWKLDFQDSRLGSHLGIESIWAIFDLQVTPMLPTKFQVNWPFGSGEEAKNRFSRWPPRGQSWLFDRNVFSYFWSTSHPDASYRVSQLVFGSGEEVKNRFSRWPSWISDHNDISYFDLQVTLKLPTKFRDSWPRDVGGVGF